jgi:hypothetical protein
MSPDDKRHGTNAGYVAGCREECCRRPHMRELKAWRLSGPRMVSSIGTRRRIQALEAIGWSRAEQSRMLGRTREYLGKVVGQEEIFASTAKAVADLYERMSMVVPVDPPTQKGGANRIHWKTRKRAAALGYAPPLAWEEGRIDDPDYTPRDWEYRPADRHELLHDLDEQGAGISVACRSLKLSREALAKWCERNGMSPTYSRLVARENGGETFRNQWSEVAS